MSKYPPSVEYVAFIFRTILVVVDTPILHFNFPPDLTQVYVLLEATDVIPALVHLAPVLAAAFTGNVGRVRKSESIDKRAISLLFPYRE